MKITPDWLREPGGISFWCYCLLAYLLALLPGVLVSQILYATVSATKLHTYEWGTSEFDPDRLRSFLGVVVFAPLAETALLGLGLVLLRKVIPSKTAAVYISALCWGLLHFTNPIRQIGSMWSFLVFSYAFVSWQSRSLSEAYIAALVPHLLGNLTVFALVIFCPDA